MGHIASLAGLISHVPLPVSRLEFVLVLTPYTAPLQSEPPYESKYCFVPYWLMRCIFENLFMGCSHVKIGSMGCSPVKIGLEDKKCFGETWTIS